MDADVVRNGMDYQHRRRDNAIGHTAIAEEHAFAFELAAAELPMVAPLAVQGRSLFEHAGYRYALYPRRGGRAPELEDDAVLERLGGFIGRLHAVSARQPFRHRRTMKPAEDARTALAQLVDGRFVPPDQEGAWIDAQTVFANGGLG